MKDPTREEIDEFFNTKYSQEDEENKEIAIYWFAHDHHSGQSSNLYKILCNSPYKPSPLTNNIIKESLRPKELYMDLVLEFT